MKKALAVCLSLLLIIPMLPPSAGAGGGSALCIGAPLPEPEGGAGRYRLPVWVEDAPGAVCGLLVTVTLSGGCIVGAEPGSGSCLTVTMCPTPDGARILLDGIPAADEVPSGVPLLWLTADASGAEQPCTVTVTITGESPLYYMEASGKILTCPADGCSSLIPCPDFRPDTQPEPADTAGTETEPGKEKETESGTASESEKETAKETESETESGAGERSAAPVPVGCREKITRDGLCVEFLFRQADGAGCPAVWPEVCPGGGRVTLCRYETDGYDCLCFGGLPTSGRVVLWTADADGRLSGACYSNGAFAGWLVQSIPLDSCYFVQK